MRAVVTGGAGFIGSNLVDRLVERGDEVVAVDDLSTGKRENLNAGATFVEGDIRDGLEFGEADVVFHLAAQADVMTSVARPEHDAAVNVVGTVQVLEAARRAGAQVVFSSTGGAIYGECDGPASEDSPLAPLAAVRDREALRRAVPRRLEPHARDGARRAAVRERLRAAAGAEPRGRRRLDLPRAHGARASRRRSSATARQTRDFVFVGDVVDALLAAAGHGGGVFNVGTGRETSVLELHRACVEVAGRAASPASTRRARARCAAPRSTSRARERELGWRAATPLADGLRADVGLGHARSAKDSAGARRKTGGVEAPAVTPQELIRPWRTATLVATVVAAIELVLLLGGATLLLANPLSRALQSRAAETARAGEAPEARGDEARTGEAPKAAAPAPVPKLARTQTSVIVLNGNGRQGAAAAGAARVHAFGYEIAGTGNARRQDYAATVVMYRTGYRAEGLRLARDLKVKVVGPLDGLKPSALMGGQLAIVIGA